MNFTVFDDHHLEMTFMKIKSKNGVEICMDMKSMMCAIYRPCLRATKLFCESQGVPKGHPLLNAIAHSGARIRKQESKLKGRVHPSVQRFHTSNGVAVNA